jgi:hypothetical protein
MRARPSRVVAAVALGALLLTACLVRVAYNNADWLMLWELDRYFNLTEAQHDFARERLREHLRWHRNGELDKTIALLQRVQQRAANEVTEAEVEQTYAEIEELRASLAVRLAADGAALFAGIDDDQLRHLERALRESNKKWEERLALPDEERRRDRTRRTLRMVRDWIGPLEAQQSDALAREAERIPDTLGKWLAYRTERQRQFVNLVRSARSDVNVVTVAFPAWTLMPLPVEFAAYRAAVVRFILDVDRVCTPKQRAYFNERLQDWIDDLQQARNESNAPRA